MMYKKFIILMGSVGATGLLHAQNTCVDPFPPAAQKSYLRIKKFDDNALNRNISLDDDNSTPFAQTVFISPNQIQLRSPSGSLIATAWIDPSRSLQRMVVMDCNNTALGTIIIGKQTITEQPNNSVTTVDYLIVDDDGLPLQYGVVDPLSDDTSVWFMPWRGSLENYTALIGRNCHNSSCDLVLSLQNYRATNNPVNDPRVLSLIAALRPLPVPSGFNYAYLALYAGIPGSVVAVGVAIYCFWFKMKSKTHISSQGERPLITITRPDPTVIEPA